MAGPQPPPLRTAQGNALNAINTFLSTPNQRNGLVKMFCGTGKSLVMYHVANRSATSLSTTSSTGTRSSISVIVAPTIALITQFALDYVLKYNMPQQAAVLCVCSENEIPRGHARYSNVEYSTNKAQISTFLARNGSSRACTNPVAAADSNGSAPATGRGSCNGGGGGSGSGVQRRAKVVLVTYQSLPNFIAVVGQSGVQVDLCMFDEAHHITGPEVGDTADNTLKDSALEISLPLAELTLCYPCG